MEASVCFDFTEHINLMVAPAGAVGATRRVGVKTISPDQTLAFLVYIVTIASTTQTLYVTLALARVIGTGICQAVKDPSKQANDCESDKNPDLPMR